MTAVPQVELWRGKLRRARKQHECAGFSEQDEQGYTYYAAPAHTIEPGELYVEARHVWEAGEDDEGNAWPMGSIPVRCCIDCAADRGYLPHASTNTLAG
jgi:hypothetical protein